MSADMKTLKRRLKARRARVGTNSEFAESAPRIVAELEAAIASLSEVEETR